MKLVEMQIEEYLARLASDAPTPGGGAASALAGAQGIALVAMVANLTVGREKYAAHEVLCKDIGARAEVLLQKLAAQVDADAAAYGGFAAALRLPKETEEEKAVRRGAISAAALYAAEVPLETMRLGTEGLLCAKDILAGYNPSCATDIACGAQELLGCVKSAWLNVAINLGSIADAARAEALRGEGMRLLTQAEEIGAFVYGEIERLYR
ncbi:MAG: cyclodeaminase/cyclohydrolase family protein [Oscillospiraceae bacterium]|nr:cyclodeaminase/cyclohydrolase family protein [Oscillospiraceae bacterium]